MWSFLVEILILLAAALVLGTVAEQLRQSAILGYLLAGTLVGPNVLGFVQASERVSAIAELGVALLLFTIGLEFSFRRLLGLGRVALVAGSAQVLITLLLAGAAAWILGLGPAAATAVGAMVALSSTACVLRLLADRAALDSLYGRSALGILLLQDLAVIPLIVLVVILGEGGGPGQAALALGRTALLAALLLGGFWLIFNVLVPRLMNIERWAANRELPILLAVVMALGSAWAAHELGLSPSLGAFVAGVLLGESPFAAQIRADVSSLRTLLVTLFFASIGMLGDPAWAVANGHVVLLVVAAIVLGKAAVVWGVLRLIGTGGGVALASGLCLAQVGEFSFVLAEIARSSAELIDEDTFDLIVSATIGTLFLTPFLVAAAPRAADWIIARRQDRAAPAPAASEAHPERKVVIIGFGPAGQAVAQSLYRRHRDDMVVIELNPRSAAVARRYGLAVQAGDARHLAVLEEAGAHRADVIVITVPDPDACRAVIHQCRHVAPNATIIARSRYHAQRYELEMAGAREVVDEEDQVGRRLAALTRRRLRA